MTSDGGQFLQILHQARPVKCDTFCSKQLRKATSCKSPLSISPGTFTCGYYDTARVYFVSGIWWRALKPSLDCLKTVSLKISIFSLFFFFFCLERSSWEGQVLIWGYVYTHTGARAIPRNITWQYIALFRMSAYIESRESFVTASYIFFLAAWMFMARNHVIPRC